MLLETSSSKLASFTPSASGISKIPIHLLVPLICLLVFVLVLLAGLVVFLRRRATVLATLAKEDMPRSTSASSIEASVVKPAVIPTLQSPDHEGVFIPADLPFIGEKGTDTRANAVHARDGQPTPSGDVPTGGCVADGSHTDTSRSTYERSEEVTHTPLLHANAVAVNAVEHSVDATPPVCTGPEFDGACQPSPRPVTQPVPEDDCDWDALGFIASPSMEELFSNPSTSTSMNDDTPPTLDHDSDGNETEASVPTPKLESPKSREVVYKPYDWKSRGFTPTPSLEDLFFNPTAPNREDISVVLDYDSDDIDDSVTEPPAGRSLTDSENVVTTETIKQSGIHAQNSTSDVSGEASKEPSVKCTQDFVSTSTLSSTSQEFQERLPWVLLESPTSASNHTTTEVLLVSSAIARAKMPPSSSNAKCTKTTVKGKRTSIRNPAVAPTKMSRPMKSSNPIDSGSSRPVTTGMTSKHRTTSANISSPRNLTHTKKFEYPSPPTSPPPRAPSTTRAGPQVVKGARFSAKISKLATDTGSTSPGFPRPISSGSGIPLGLGRKSATNSNNPLSTKSVRSTPPPTPKSTKAERTTPPTGRRMSTTIGSPSGHSPSPYKTPMKRPQTTSLSVRASLPIATKPCSRHTAAYSARLGPSRPKGGTTASSSGPSLPLRTTDSPKRLRAPLGSISNVDGVSRKS